MLKVPIARRPRSRRWQSGIMLMTIGSSPGVRVPVAGSAAIAIGGSGLPVTRRLHCAEHPVPASATTSAAARPAVAGGQAIV